MCLRTPSEGDKMLQPVLLLALLGLSAGYPSAEQAGGGRHWVVIVAGSNGWYNYRHQVRRTGSAV